MKIKPVRPVAKMVKSSGGCGCGKSKSAAQTKKPVQPPIVIKTR